MIVWGHFGGRLLVRLRHRPNVEPFDRIAITVLEDERDQGQPHESAGPVLPKISQNLAAAAIVPMRFGSTPDAGIIGLHRWQAGLVEHGLLWAAP
jgi:hypothetical protein